MSASLPDFADRFIGCLLGMAIGDALGVPGAGRNTAIDVEGYQPRLDENGKIEIPAGQFSLNTELALCLLETMVTSDGFVDPELAVYRFRAAMAHPNAYLKDDAEAEAIERAVDTEAFQDGAAQDNRRSAGPAARVIPVALAHALSDLNVALITREVLRSVLLTHADPVVVNGAFAAAHAVRLVLRQEVPREVVIEEVLSMIDEDDVAKAIRAGVTDGSPNDVAAVVAAALHAYVDGAGDFRGTVQRATASGGAAHLSGALAGALAGAETGAQAIPEQLVDGLDGRAYVLMAGPALLRTAQMRAGLFFQLHVR